MVTCAVFGRRRGLDDTEHVDQSPLKPTVQARIPNSESGAAAVIRAAARPARRRGVGPSNARPWVFSCNSPAPVFQPRVARTADMFRIRGSPCAPPETEESAGPADVLVIC